MAKVSLPENMKEQRKEEEFDPETCGPFLTISRQFGCYGFSLGLLLLDILNEETEETAWQIYHKDILAKLAAETNLAADVLEQQRRNKPSMFGELLQSFKRDRVPSGYEVRNRMTAIIRALAIEGHAIIIGQGGAGATQGLTNGLSVRLEAPEQWRVKQIAFRETLSETEAKLRVRAKEREREYLRKLYETRFPRKPPFHLTYDCSVFSMAHIAQHIVYIMRLMKYV